MLEQVDLTLALKKRAYKSLSKAQEARLFELQRRLFDEKIPVIVVFEGWDAAGKGTIINALTKQLDPRGFKVLATQAPRSHEQQKPWLWRFWMEIPRRGQMAIFDRSWYGRVMIERVEGLTPMPNWIRAYEEINDFERTLAADRTVIFKFWLHISKQEQLRRFIHLTQDQGSAWQVTAEDWERHRKYDEYWAAVEDMLANTSTAVAPWTVIPSTDLYYKTCAVMEVIIAGLEDALGQDRSVWEPLEEARSAGKAATQKDRSGKMAKPTKTTGKKAKRVKSKKTGSPAEKSSAGEEERADTVNSAENADDETAPVEASHA